MLSEVSCCHIISFSLYFINQNQYSVINFVSLVYHATDVHSSIQMFIHHLFLLYRVVRWSAFSVIDDHLRVSVFIGNTAFSVKLRVVAHGVCPYSELNQSLVPLQEHNIALSCCLFVVIATDEVWSAHMSANSNIFRTDASLLHLLIAEDYQSLSVSIK